jgi:hypothetical protein
MSETTQAVLALILVILAIPVLRFIEKSLRKILGSFSTFLIMMIPTLGLWILLKPTFYLFFGAVEEAAKFDYSGTAEFSQARCPWCKESTYLNFQEGKQIDSGWKYKNKDGTKDERRISNPMLKTYVSQYLCKNCGAESEFHSQQKKNPSKRTAILLGPGLLTKEGKADKRV